MADQLSREELSSWRAEAEADVRDRQPDSVVWQRRLLAVLDELDRRRAAPTAVDLAMDEEAVSMQRPIPQ
jgi:hypothetical protein